MCADVPMTKYRGKGTTIEIACSIQEYLDIENVENANCNIGMIATTGSLLRLPLYMKQPGYITSTGEEVRGLTKSRHDHAGPRITRQEVGCSKKPG